MTIYSDTFECAHASYSLLYTVWSLCVLDSQVCSQPVVGIQDSQSPVAVGGSLHIEVDRAGHQQVGLWACTGAELLHWTL